MARLDRYPSLAAWYREGESDPSDHIERFVWATCRALDAEDPKLLSYFASALQSFLSVSKSPLQDFRSAEAMLAAGGVNFMEFATEAAEIAVRFNYGDDYFFHMSLAADKTGLAVFRFLSAWTALNCEELEKCVQECEKVDEPFACVSTLHGQALLELGEVVEAIELLEIATTLSPKEVLSQFQLAKAYHIAGQFEKAWQTLEACDNLARGNEEIGTMMAIVALSSPDHKEYASQAWQHLSYHLQNQPGNEVMITMLMDLCFVLEDRDKLNFIFDNCDWNTLKQDLNFMKKLPWILRKLDEFLWKKEASSFLVQMAEPKTQSISS